MKRVTNKIDLKQHIQTFPNTSGVYLMKDSEGKVIYVGKAGALRKRVRSYFVKKADSPKIQVLKEKVASLEYISTPTEVEALLLEAHLINTYDPKYNTLLKDDKTYPLLQITGEAYPRVRVTRDRRDKKATYYGPFTDARLLREAVVLLNAIFPIRKCSQMPKVPCLYYHIHQCLGPCFEENVHTAYAKVVSDIKSFLKGKRASFVEYLNSTMIRAARELRFEEAERIKQQIKALETVKAKRFVLTDPGASIGLSGSAELRRLLHTKHLPQRIMCFDVSNIQGKWAVASRVSFFREVPEKKNYRRYKIKTVAGIDDYQMMQEAVRRMLSSFKSKKEKDMPDLLIIDGGKGHRVSVQRVLDEAGYENLPCIALAKQFEEIFTAYAASPLRLPDGSPALNLLKRIRDEAHRFAIQYHRAFRSKSVSASLLDEIPGMSERKKKQLFKACGSFDKLKKMTVYDICCIPGIGKKTAGQVVAFLKQRK